MDYTWGGGFSNKPNRKQSIGINWIGTGEVKKGCVLLTTAIIFMEHFPIFPLAGLENQSSIRELYKRRVNLFRETASFRFLRISLKDSPKIIRNFPPFSPSRLANKTVYHSARTTKTQIAIPTEQTLLGSSDKQEIFIFHLQRGEQSILFRTSVRSLCQRCFVDVSSLPVPRSPIFSTMISLWAAGEKVEARRGHTKAQSYSVGYRNVNEREVGRSGITAKSRQSRSGNGN